MNAEKLGKVAVKSGIWYTIGNMFLKGCVFFSLPIFTRILSTEDFGIYNTYIAYEGILTAILGLGFYGTVKNAKLDFKEKFDEYLSSILSLSLIFLCFMLFIANIGYKFYQPLIGFDRSIVNCLILQSFRFIFNIFLWIEIKHRV